MTAGNLNSQPFHPGIILRDTLNRNGISLEKFASAAGFSLEYTQHILDGKVRFDDDLCHKVYEVTKIQSSVWLQHQKYHDDWAERNADKIEKELDLYKEIETLFGPLVPIEVIKILLETKSFEDRRTVLDKIMVIHGEYVTQMMK